MTSDKKDIDRLLEEKTIYHKDNRVIFTRDASVEEMVKIISDMIRKEKKREEKIDCEKNDSIGEDHIEKNEYNKFVYKPGDIVITKRPKKSSTDDSKSKVREPNGFD